MVLSEPPDPLNSGDIVSAPRAVRIPRERPPPRSTEPALPPVDVRKNRGGWERAVRIAVVYAGAVLLLTAVLSALDLTSANAGRPGVREGLELFLVVAGLLILGSAFYAVSPAPRFVEVRPDSVVVVGRWGRRRSFGPLGTFGIQVVRRLPSGPLTPRPVEVVRVVDTRGRPATYEVETGLFDPAGVPK